MAWHEVTHLRQPISKQKDAILTICGMRQLSDKVPGNLLPFMVWNW